MSDELTKEEQLAAKVAKAVEKATFTKNGKDAVTIRATIAGDGEIHTGKGAKDRLTGDATMVVTPEIALSLTTRGLAEPVAKPSAK